MVCLSAVLKTTKERWRCVSGWFRTSRGEILHHLHDGPLGAHLGEKKIKQKLKERFYWPGHAADVRNWCRSCEPCAQRKTPIPKPRAPLVSIQMGHPMQLVATGIVGPFPESTSGNSLYSSCSGVLHPLGGSLPDSMSRGFYSSAQPDHHTAGGRALFETSGPPFVYRLRLATGI